MAIDYELIRTTIGAAWCKGVYSDISPKPTKQMLVPGVGPMGLKQVVKYYETYCKQHNIKPVALTVAAKEKVNVFETLFENK